MGGIGITVYSTEPPSELYKPIAHLPAKVVDEIAKSLGISAKSKAALMGGQIDLPNDVEVTITRLINHTSVTLKKTNGGAKYEVTYGGTTTTVPIP